MAFRSGLPTYSAAPSTILPLRTIMLPFLRLWYAYGPAKGLPDVGMGAFPQNYYDLAIKNGWIVVSMKNDWNRVFAFDK